MFDEYNIPHFVILKCKDHSITQTASQEMIDQISKFICVIKSNQKK